jgi:predicted dehydrogenase
VDKTDPFVYIGCHYIDLVYFITGLKPVEVSVQGVERKFPNGKAGYLWSLARVKWENGALLAVTNGLGYPDDAAGSNDQGLIMFCEGNDKSGMIRHDDHDRGVSYSYLEGIGPGGSRFNYVSPDFFRYVPWEGEGYKPIGYGVDSVSAIIGSMREVEAAAAGLSGEASLAKRREAIRRIDGKGIIATPANSSINELVVEAARLSIREDGRPALISYGERPGVSLR